MQLVLIRHASVQAEPGRPARDWALSDAGRAAASALAEHPSLAGVQLLATSPEPKAVATAKAAARGRPVLEVPELAELDRSAVGWLASQAEYTDLVHQIFAQPTTSARGCEPAAAAVQRFIDALAHVRAKHPAAALAVVSHGLILTLYLAHLRRRQATVADWQRLRMPDVAVVDYEHRHVIADFGS